MVENLQSQKYELERPDNGEKYKYHMIKHSHEKSNPKNRDRLDMLKHWKKNAFEDGLNVSQAPYQHLYSTFVFINISEFNLHAGEHEFQKILCKYNCRFTVRAFWTQRWTDTTSNTNFIGDSSFAGVFQQPFVDVD